MMSGALTALVVVGTLYAASTIAALLTLGLFLAVANAVEAGRD